MFSSGRKTLIKRLRRGRETRQRFVESHLNKGIAFQIRAIRDRQGMSQEQLGALVGSPQNAISRLESPAYGRFTLTTLKKVAAAFDVGLVVRFVPFSEMVDWVSGIPRRDPGLTPEALAVASFTQEEEAGVFDRLLGPIPHPVSTGTPGGLFLVSDSTSERALLLVPDNIPRRNPAKAISGTSAPAILRESLGTTAPSRIAAVGHC